MRIFYAADHEPFPGNRLWHNNLFLPLCDLGHDVVPFAYDLTPHFHHADPAVPGSAEFIAERRPRLEAELLRQIEAAHARAPIQVFFSYFYSAFCRPETIAAIRALGIVTINWYCNGSYQLHLVSEIAPAYDVSLVPEKFRLEDYRRLGARPIYCQEAANPSIYKPYPLPSEFDVTFVGQRYGDRPHHIRALLDAGVDVRVWGPGWTSGAPGGGVGAAHPGWLARGGRIARRLLTADGWRAAGRRAAAALRPSEPGIPERICGGPLGDEDLVRMYSRSKVSLGFSSVGDTHRGPARILQVRLRDFEAPMSGAFYLVEHMEELLEFFEPGKEIACYRDGEELVAKCRHYLAHEDERERIREACLRRARAEHTWQKRFDRVFREIGLAP